MKTSEQVKQEFMDKLKALFKEYNAGLSADDKWIGYAECGQDVRMDIYIPSVYVDNETISEGVEIDLGKYFP
jgi:hypothetical protein